MHVIFSEFGAQVMKHNRLFRDDVSRANTVAVLRGMMLRAPNFPVLSPSHVVGRFSEVIKSHQFQN
jgi:hypothetical protein